jgi:Spirocyclase AveC-like
MATSLNPTSGVVRSSARPDPLAGQRRRVRPVVGWALLGGAYLSVVLYTLMAWVGSGQAQRTDTHVLPPMWVRVELRLFDTVLPLIALWLVYRYLVRPWRRERRVTTEGMFLIAWITMYGQDLWMNYLQPIAFFNSYSINLGSWYDRLPGWSSPNGNMNPEPFMHWIPGYIVAGFMVTLLGTKLLRRLERRFPRMSPAGMIACLYIFMFFFDIMLEGLVVLGRDYAYLTTVPGPYLFKGHYYQFPLMESLFWGFVWTGGTALMHFRDDKGRTLAERGVDGIRMSGRRQQVARALAIVGVMNAIMFLTYDIPWNIAGTHTSGLPRDTPAYLLSRVCGPGTAFECPRPDQPIQKKRATPIPPDPTYFTKLGR